MTERAVSDPTMDRSPIHASYVSLLFAGIGLIVWGTGWALVSNQPSLNASSFANVLSFFGALFVAIGIITHIDHLAKRIGIGAVTLGIIASASAVIAALPGMFKLDTLRWQQTTLALRGIEFLCAALALVLVITHKKSIESARAAAPDSNNPKALLEPIHASIASLTLGSVGFAMIGVRYLGNMGIENGHLHAAPMLKFGGGGWLLVALGIIIHIDHLTNRLGWWTVSLGVGAAAILGLDNVARVIVTDMTQPGTAAYRNFFLALAVCYGMAGVAFLFVAARKYNLEKTA
ncbi:MAG: hypothetical protein WCK41_04300 [Actinomycetes bacterium]